MLKTTLEQWRMFRAVVDHGGFNQASQAINKSQSTIHHAVQKLENQLGVELLEVEGRKTTLTDAGEMMLRRARLLLDEAYKLEDIADGLNQGVETHLNLAVDQIFPRNILYCALEEVSKAYPLVRIELIETVLSGANELLRKGAVDISVASSSLDPEHTEQLCSVDWLQVAHPDHPLHQLNRTLTFEDLRAYRQIVVRDSGLEVRQDGGWLHADQRWTVSHMHTSLDLVSNGLGFASYPRHLVQSLIDCGRVKVLPVEQSKNAVTIYLNFKEADTLGPVARFFIGELRDQLDEHSS